MQQPKRTALVLLGLLLVLQHAAAATPSERVAELAQRRAQRKDGVLTFSSSDFERFAAKSGRDYSLVFFINSARLASNSNMKLPQLRSEYGLMAQAFRAGSEPDKVFFAELVYESCQELVQRLNVKALPFIFVWGPEAVAKEGRSIKLGKATKCGPKINAYPWPAEELVSCVSGKTGVAAGPVDRPSMLKHPLFPLLLLGFIVVGGAAAWKLYRSPLVRITALWALGALGVYWFATSGGMYNIIRGVPLTTRNQQGKTVYWMEGRQGQLGAEGFIMGSSYIFFSTMLASLTYVVPRIRSASARGVLSLLLVLTAAFTAHRILEAYHAKSGLRMRHFFSFQ